MLDTLGSLNNLAMVYLQQGRTAEAEQFQQRGLRASERMLGVEHPNTLAALNNLALIYGNQKSGSQTLNRCLNGGSNSACGHLESSIPMRSPLSII
jgi:hypothetical protein